MMSMMTIGTKNATRSPSPGRTMDASSFVFTGFPRLLDFDAWEAAEGGTAAVSSGADGSAPKADEASGADGSALDPAMVSRTGGSAFEAAVTSRTDGSSPAPAESFRDSIPSSENAAASFSNASISKGSMASSSQKSSPASSGFRGDFGLPAPAAPRISSISSEIFFISFCSIKEYSFYFSSFFLAKIKILLNT